VGGVLDIYEAAAMIIGLISVNPERRDYVLLGGKGKVASRFCQNSTTESCDNNGRYEVSQTFTLCSYVSLFCTVSTN
jgi:hypothetical protein